MIGIQRNIREMYLDVRQLVRVYVLGSYDGRETSYRNIAQTQVRVGFEHITWRFAIEPSHIMHVCM